MSNAASAPLAPPDGAAALAQGSAARHGGGSGGSGRASHNSCSRRSIRSSRRWRAVQVLFWLALGTTLVCLLAPASAVLSAKVWVASWLPMASAIDRLDATAQSDKLVHASLFVVLGALAARGWPRPRQRWRALAGLLLLGVLTEALQSLIPGRSASLGDWLADALGACVGLYLRPLAPAGGAVGVDLEGAGGDGGSGGGRAGLGAATDADTDAVAATVAGDSLGAGARRVPRPASRAHGAAGSPPER